jgi:cytochrome c
MALILTTALVSRVPIGRPATSSEIAAADITVFADGSGLPPGSGTAREGKPIFERQCAACHSMHGEGSAAYPPLAGGIGSLASSHPVLTVGSYWPYAPTVWDYIHRAMPYQRPGTLGPSDVYALTAYVLKLNGIVSDTARLDRATLPLVRMPNRNGFITDSR